MTQGSLGSTIVTEVGERSFLESQQVDVVDTVGAGDSFTAVIAVGMLQGVELATMHRYATRMAGYVCTNSGATPLVPADLIGF